MEAPAGGVDDMTKLSYLHEPGVLQNLKTRYELNEIYVSCPLFSFDKNATKIITLGNFFISYISSCFDDRHILEIYLLPLTHSKGCLISMMAT